ncbi:MAG: hypothetical protein COA47_12705 [Robiginitomaculum sp.]|nr:MAG: hypothetical protein COA47_12705 [Robiginitomaculum sp.]
MTKANSETVPYSVRSIYPALTILVLAAAVYFWSQSYGEVARRLPSLVAITLTGLAVVDLWTRTKLPGSEMMRAFWGADFTRREMTHNPAVKKELGLMAWIGGCFVGMALIGILPTMPVFCVLFTRIRSQRPLKQAVFVGLIVLGFEAFVFELMLNYELYRGLLFEDGGVSNW